MAGRLSDRIDGDIIRMLSTIFKSFLKTGLGSVATIGFGIVATKILAVVVSADGIGLFSIIRQTMQTASIIATMGGGVALVQGLAGREGREKEIYLLSVFWLMVLSTLAVACFLVLFAPWLAPIIFGKSETQLIDLVRWMALPLFLSSFMAFMNGVMNGYGEIGKLAAVQQVGPLVTVVLIYFVAKRVQSGDIQAFIWMSSISTLIASSVIFWISRGNGWLKPIRFDRIAIEGKSARHFFSISGTMLITSFCDVGMLLAIKSMILHKEGLHAVGIFDAAWTLSMTYITLVLGSFGTYYLPALSKVVDHDKKHELINNVLRLTLLLSMPLIVTVIVLKPLTIAILYTKEFNGSLDILRWMLIGDYLKATSWVFGMTALAYADMKMFFWKQIVWWSTFFGLAWLSVDYFQKTEGIAIAYLILLVLNLAYLIYYVRTRHGIKLSSRIISIWLIGLLVIVGASLTAWSEIVVNWYEAIVWIFLASIFSWMTLEVGERARFVKTLVEKFK